MNTEMTTALLERLASGAEGGLDMSDLFSQAAEQDPRVGLVMKLMSQRAAAKEADDESRRQAAEARAVERREAFRKLSLQVRAIYAELEELRGINDTLAAALGACHLCWGRDSECDACRGRGRPGNAYPDRLLFEEWIEPSVRALGSMRATDQASRSIGPGWRPTQDMALPGKPEEAIT